MGLGSIWYQIGNKTHYIPQVSKIVYRKRITMLTGLKTSTLAYKYVLYRPEHNASEEHHVIGF